MAWCAGNKYTTDAVAGDDSNAEFFRVLRGQILGEASASPSLATSSSTFSSSSVSNEKKPPQPGTFLEFMFLDLNKQSMQLLLQALYYHKNVHEIKTVVFHGCRIRDEKSLELMSHLFHLYTHWQHVEISCLCQGLGNEQARVLIMEILKSKELDSLNISSMGITDGLIFWKDLLVTSHPATPSNIVMRSSRINFEHTRDFLSVLPMLVENPDKRHFLKHLDLSACRMDDASVEIVASGLKTLNVQLESLALKGNRLTPRSIPVLAQLINDHPLLRDLDLSMNTRLFSTEDETASANVDKIIQAAIPRDNSGSMERLVLSKTSVGEAAAITMIQNLESNRILQELDLNFNLLGEKVMAQITGTLPKMKGLRQLLLHGLHFSQRNAATNPHDQRQVLWNALQVNTSLVKIQGLNMFLGAGRPELASLIQEHLSERNQALYEARSIVKDEPKKRGDEEEEDSFTLKKNNRRKKPPSNVWPICLEKWGVRGSWTASAVYLFLQNNSSAIAEYGSNC